MFGCGCLLTAGLHHKQRVVVVADKSKEKYEFNSLLHDQWSSSCSNLCWWCLAFRVPFVTVSVFFSSIYVSFLIPLFSSLVFISSQFHVSVIYCSMCQFFNAFPFSVPCVSFFYGFSRKCLLGSWAWPGWFSRLSSLAGCWAEVLLVRFSNWLEGSVGWD